MLYNAFDMNYLLLVVPALLFSLWAQSRVSSSFGKYSRQRARITGAEAAAEVLRRAGVYGVSVEHTPGNLTDHYDPRDNVIRLSDGVYGAATVAAVGVAAHEAGHAAQYSDGYSLVKLRAAIIPVTNFGSKLSVPLVIFGLALGFTGLINIGILLFGLVVLFQLLTLPVEFNASSRAVKALDESGLLGDDELPGAKKVLSAAALTYVAALAVSLAQLVRLIGLAGRRRR